MGSLARVRRMVKEGMRQCAREMEDGWWITIGGENAFECCLLPQLMTKEIDRSAEGRTWIRMIDRHTDEQRGRQTAKQGDRETDSLKDRQTERQADI